VEARPALKDILRHRWSNVRVLDDRDLEALADLNALVESMEEAFRAYAAGSYTMPPRPHFGFGPNTLLVMPCEAAGYLGTKVVAVAPGNRRQGLPVVQAVMLLFRAGTAEPLAVLDGRSLTGLRTGAASAVAMRHLAPQGARRIGIVGAGVQGRYHARFAAAVLPLEEVMVYDHRPENARRFAEEISPRLGDVRVRPAATPEELVRCCPVVVTATTSAEPVLPDEPALFAGRLVVAVGSFRPHMRELPEALLRGAARVYVDTEQALEESGDLAVPLARGWFGRDRIEPLGRALQSPVRAGPGSTVVYKSVGMALLDVFAAAHLYERAGGNDRA